MGFHNRKTMGAANMSLVETARSMPSHSSAFGMCVIR
jgi:hypothetical protein